MKTLILKSNFAFLCRILFMAGLILMVCLGKSWGQYTVYYATYNSPDTGGTKGTAGAAGGLGGPGALGSYTVSGLANINDLDYTNFTTLTAISGSNGTGLGGADGGPSSVYINLKFSGAITPSASNPIILKLTATVLTNITIQAYNSVGTTVGSPVAVSSLITRGNNEYVFTPVGNCASIRIITTSNSGTALGGLSTITANVYYAFIYDPACIPPLYTTTSTTGISIGTIQNPSQAIDGNLTTYSNFSVLLSAVGTMTQSIYYDSLASNVQDATITISAPAAALLNLSLLGSITLQAYNGTTAVGSPTTLSSLLTLNLLNLAGSDKPFNVSIAPGGTFNRIDVTNSSALNLLSGFRIYEAAITPNTPQFTFPVNDTVFVCKGSFVNLTADNPGTGNELRWYASFLATDVAVLDTGSYTPPFVITADTVFYVAAGKIGCTPSSQRVPVRVLIKPIPIKPTATDLSICSGTSTTLAVSSPIGGNTYTWYKTSTGGTSIHTGTTYTTSTLISDTTIYVQSDSANSCSSNRDTVIVTIKALPAKPTAVDPAICTGTSTILAVTSPIAGNTYTWYKTSTGGTSVGTGTTYTTSILTADTTIYLQVDSTNGCSSKRDTVIVSIKPLTAKPLAPNTAICSGTSTTLAVTSPVAGNTYTWYKVATGGTAFATGTSYTTSVLTADTTIYLQSDSTNGCSSKRDTVIVSIKPLPVKPLAPNTAICSGTSTTLAVTTPIVGNTYTWYKVATGGTAFATGTSYTTTLLTADTTIYLQSDSTNGCSSKRDTVIVTVKPLPAKPSAPDLSICSGTNTTLTVTNPLGGHTYTWYKTSTGGTSIATGTSYTTSVLTTDTTIYLQADSVNGCSSKRDTVIVTIKSLPAKPLAPNIAICSGTSTTLTVTGPIAGNTYTWYKVANAGTAFATGTSYTTSVLTADTTIYLQSDSTNGCSSKRDTVIVSVKPLPVKPTVVNTSICSGASTTLVITNSIVGNTYNWYKIAAGGTSIHTGTSYTTSVLTADTTIYVQSDSTNGCSTNTRDTVIVTIKPLPAKPSALDSIICSGTSIVLAVVNPIAGNAYNWFKTSTAGATIHTGTTYTTSALTADTTIYLQSDSTNGCSSKRDTVTITTNPIPSIQFATPVNVCDGITITSITYTNAQNTPAYYHFAWSVGAISAGFSNDTTDISILNPIPILIPNTANPASYSGNLIIKNAINGHQCPHTYPFTLNLVALPAALTITSFE